MVVLPDSPLSLWLDQGDPVEPEASLSGDLDVDVAVIGGGLTGFASACELRRAEPSASVAVLEARTAAYGASGRNGSFAMTVVGLGIGTTALVRGKKFLTRAHAYMERCVDELERFIDDEQLDCDKIRPGFLRVATTPGYAKRLQSQVELMQSLGFDGITWIDADETKAMVSSPRYLGALWEPRLLLIDPAKLVREEKRLALRLGARVFENTPVLAVASSAAYGDPAEGFRLLTPGGSVTAGRLVFATNAYSHLFPDLARKQVPAFTYMIATEPLSDEQLAAIGWQGEQGLEDARNLIHYYRLTPDRRLVMGGGPVGLKAGNDLDRDSDEAAWRHLEEHIQWLWPHLGGLRVTHRWGGPFSVTMDLTPVLGYVGEGRRAVYSLGCIGHGVAMSYLNARVLADLLLRPDRPPQHECPFVNRRVLPWPREPFATVVKHALRDYLRAEDAFYERGSARL
ncbi:MAG: FAD-binding oxidoreductase [Actinobacteria bacterium]|nr:FAD-binding oxidoreductase [Actinomycetota bacterium]